MNLSNVSMPTSVIDYDDVVKDHAEWIEAVREANRVQELYLARDVVPMIAVETPVRMHQYHTELDPTSSARIFKTIRGSHKNAIRGSHKNASKSASNSRSKEDQRHRRLIFLHADFSSRDRCLGIKFIYFCKKKGYDLTRDAILAQFGDIMPILGSLSEYHLAFEQPPLSGSLLFEAAWLKILDLSALFTVHYPISDTETKVRALLASGTFQWIGRDRKDTPVMMIDLTPARSLVVSEDLRYDKAAYLKCLRFCMEWGRRYLLIPGVQETANILINIIDINPHAVLASQVRQILLDSGLTTIPHFVNKIWFLNNSFHWRTIWNMFAPMLGERLKENIFFYSTIEDINPLLPSNVARQLVMKPSVKPTVPYYPFPTFGCSEAPADDDRVQGFNRLWDSPKAMKGCPWLIKRVPPGAGMMSDRSEEEERELIYQDLTEILSPKRPSNEIPPLGSFDGSEKKRSRSKSFEKSLSLSRSSSTSQSPKKPSTSPSQTPRQGRTKPCLPHEPGSSEGAAVKGDHAMAAMIPIATSRSSSKDPSSESTAPLAPKSKIIRAEENKEDRSTPKRQSLCHSSHRSSPRRSVSSIREVARADRSLSSGPEPLRSRSSSSSSDSSRSVAPRRHLLRRVIPVLESPIDAVSAACSTRCGTNRGEVLSRGHMRTADGSQNEEGDDGGMRPRRAKLKAKLHDAGWMDYDEGHNRVSAPPVNNRDRKRNWTDRIRLFWSCGI